MSEVLVEFDRVWKRFKKGERGTSLRDLIPNMARRIAGHRRTRKSPYFWALQDVSFQVRRGETLGIIGPNGAGKSTALKVLSGIMRETQGSSTINGKVAALIEVGAGFHEDLTGRENMYLNGTIMGMKKRDIDKQFDTMVDFAGVRAFVDTPVKRYSTGMKVRLGFAVAAHLSPDVLLIDEVLAVGDAAFQRKCLNRMAEYARGDRAVILVSHNMHHIRTLCQKAVLLNHGQIVAMGEANEVITRYKSLSDEMADESRITSKENSPAKIKDVKFIIDGVPGKTIGTGQDLAIEVHYECYRDLDELGVTFAFYGADGQFRTGNTTALDRIDLGSRKGEGTVRIEFPELGVEPGSYALSIGLWDKACFDPYDWHQKAYPLFVEERLPLQGTYRLPHRWSLSGAAFHESTDSASNAFE